MKLTITIEEKDLQALNEFLKVQVSRVSGLDAAITRAALIISEVIETDVIVDAKVTTLLAQIKRIPPDLIKNEHSLRFHLAMGVTEIKGLAGPLTLIAQSIKATAQAITITEAGQLTTVQSCIDLVKTKLK